MLLSSSPMGLCVVRLNSLTRVEKCGSTGTGSTLRTKTRDFRSRRADITVSRQMAGTTGNRVQMSM